MYSCNKYLSNTYKVTGSFYSRGWQTLCFSKYFSLCRSCGPLGPCCPSCPSCPCCPCSSLPLWMKAATGNRCGCAPIQLYLQKQAAGRFWLLAVSFGQLEYISEGKHAKSSDSLDVTFCSYLFMNNMVRGKSTNHSLSKS